MNWYTDPHFIQGNAIETMTTMLSVTRVSLQDKMCIVWLKPGLTLYWTGFSKQVTDLFATCLEWTILILTIYNETMLQWWLNCWESQGSHHTMRRTCFMFIWFMFFIYYCVKYMYIVRNKKHCLYYVSFDTVMNCIQQNHN